MSTSWDNPATHNQYIAALIASIGAFSLGTSIGWSAPAQHEVMQNGYGFTVTLKDYAWVCGLFSLGCSCGAVPIGALTNCIGRKTTMLLVAPFYILGWALLVYAPNLYILWLGRFLQGLSGGSYIITVPLYCTEIADTALRKTLNSFFGLFFAMGILFAYCVGAFTDLLTLTYACAIWPGIFLVTFIFMPETPIYYLQKKKPQKAQKSLKWLRGSAGDISMELDYMKSSMVESPNCCYTFRQKDTLKALGICIFLMLFVSSCGGIVIITYVSFIIEEADTGFGHNTGESTAIVGIFLFIGVILFVFFIISAERRPLLIFSVFLVTLNNALVATYFLLKDRQENYLDTIKWIPICNLCCFMLFFGLGLGPLPICIVLDLIPDNFLAEGTGIICTISEFFAFVAVQAFPLTLRYWGISNSFWILTIISLMAIVYIYFFVPETRSTSQNEETN